MTLWERVEELTRRVGELEARVPKAVAPATLMNEDGLSERSVRSLWMGPLPTAEQPRAAPIGALEAISDVLEAEPSRELDPDRWRRAYMAETLISAGQFGTMQGQAQMLKEALELLTMVPPGCLSEYPVLAGRIQHFLARARVATKEP